MEFNPFTAQARELIDALREQRSEADDHRKQLKWYDEFNPEAAVAEADANAARLNSDLGRERKNAEVGQADVTRLRPPTLLRLFFPALMALESVRTSRSVYREAKAALEATAKRVSQLEAEQSQAILAVAGVSEQAERHRQFDRPAVVARLDALEADIASTAHAHRALEAKAAALDEKLATVVPSLRAKIEERDDIQKKLRIARGYVDDLRRASDDRAARARTHDAAERDLGTGKPGQFVNAHRGNLDRLERDVRKLEDRARDIVRQFELATDVRRIIIDGSNLCHARGQRIGLFALRALQPHLLAGRRVDLIFDATITRVLNKSEEALKAEFPGMEVRIADSKTRADKLILVLADEPGTYVLSADRFRDYPDMTELIEAKRINVEMFADRAIIDDLDIDVRFNRIR